MTDSQKNGALKTIHRDLGAIGLSVDETIGRNATNQHTRTSLRDIRDAIDSLQAKITDLSTSASTLTKREEEILKALATGKTALAIAHNLSISEPTVKTHMMAIYRKLNVNNKTSALAEAMRRGLLSK
jgi:DNA-binding CsgD family transcriptional regulator